MIVFVAKKLEARSSSRVVKSLEKRIRKGGLRLRPLIGVIKFITNGKRVVIRVGCVISQNATATAVSRALYHVPSNTLITANDL